LSGKYTKYKPEFPDEIAKLVVESNRAIAEVAREHGLNETTVRGDLLTFPWVAFEGRTGSFPGPRQWPGQVCDLPFSLPREEA
jgi:hypothetical protein